MKKFKFIWFLYGILNEGLYIYVCLGDVNMWVRVIYESYEYWFFMYNDDFIVFDMN